MPRAPAAESATSSGTVARVTLLLQVLAQAEGESSLGEIAQRMKLPASTTHRLLNLLHEQGFVDRDPARRSYRVGLEFLRVAGLVTSRAQLAEVAHSFMQQVVDSCDEACMLSVYMPRHRAGMITRVIYGSHPLRYEATLYQPSSLVWGATGLGILAFLPPAVIDDIVAHEGPSPATGKRVHPARLRTELARIRSQGYAHTRGQKIPGAVGISAPVFDSSGVVAALCLTLPESRFQEGKQAHLARSLRQQAAALSHALGGRPPAGTRGRD